MCVVQNVEINIQIRKVWHDMYEMNVELNQNFNVSIVVSLRNVNTT